MKILLYPAIGFLLILAITRCSMYFKANEFSKELQIRCNHTAYPPLNSTAIHANPYIVNLDLPPKLRWRAVMKDKQKELSKMVDEVKTLIEAVLGKKVFQFIFDYLPKVAETFPYPYNEEIFGISEYANISVAHVTMYNIFYEAFALCTSIIAVDRNGKLYHGRNLDNGGFLGWDSKNHTWRVAEYLRPLSVQLQWVKNGSIIYESVNFAGYIGILTAYKKNKFTFSLDKRLSFTEGFKGMFEWIFLHDYNQKWVSFLTREVLENAEDYYDAQKLLSLTRTVAPVYFILGGTKSNEACIITRGRDNFNILTFESSEKGQRSWHLVQTNYDNWKPPPFYDDRRRPAVYCLNQFTQAAVSPDLIYNVLSTKPIRNKETIYTTLMEVNSSMRSWLRWCPDPCWPW